jgi:cytochrome c biogenesis protein CcmG, thiol:disulfide interchange protein DsbE
MRKFVVPGVIAVAAAAALALLAFGAANRSGGSSINDELASGHYPVAPDYRTRLPLLDGSGERSLASFRGKVVVLNMFASWCEPCQAEAPLLAREQRVLSAHNGTLVGVTYQDSSGDAKEFVRHYHVTYPVVRDVDGDFASSLGVNGVPETFVIGRDGRIMAFNGGPLTAQWLKQTLPPILAGKA